VDSAALRAIEQGMAAKIDAELMSRGGGVVQRAAKSHRASEIGFACDTYQALRWLKPEAASPYDLGTMKRFYLGKVLERPNIRLMQDAGLEVAESGQDVDARKFSLDWTLKNISGRNDAWVRVPEVGPDIYPLEHKTAAPSTYRMLRKMYDDGGNWRAMLESSFSFLCKFPGQLQCYEFLAGVEWGVWFIFEKASGDYFFWVNQLDYEYAETLIQRAERTAINVRAGTIPTPKRIPLCRGCDFERGHCFTGRDFGEGYDIVMDPEELAEWEAKIDRYMELTEAESSELEELREVIGERFKGKTSIVGKWFLESKPYLRTNYDVPKELKLQYARQSEVKPFPKISRL
jgi:hypothetical protein